MRVHVTVSLDVDTAEWAAIYGGSTAANRIASDVVAHLRAAVTAHYADLDNGARVVAVGKRLPTPAPARAARRW